ncbi:MAG: cyclase family protein [Bellilinea sp.]
MRFHDISVTVTSMLPTWPGDPKVELDRVEKIEEGANANVSRVAMGVHTGTHVDAPYHFLEDGTTVDTLPLDILIGSVQVVDLGDQVDLITADVLQKASIIPGVSRILFKTRNSQIWERGETEFQTSFVGISADGAEYLVSKGIQLVGIDYLSIAPYKNSRPTHQILLNAKVIIIEGLDLSNVKAGVYQLVCLPLKLGGSDGAPARTVLIEQ